MLATCLVLIDWPWLSSLFVTVALTATGIGVSVRVWRRSDQLGSAKGALMLDVAELDDLFGVVPQETFGVVVTLAALTMVGVPLALRFLLP